MGAPTPHPEGLERYEILTSESQRYRRPSTSIELVLRSYAVIGVMIALGSLGYFAFTFLKIDLTTAQQAALLIAGVSAGVAGFSFAFLTIRKQQSVLKIEMLVAQDLGAVLVRQWAYFEMLGRELLTRRGQSFNRQSPRAIIAALLAERLISEADIEQLHVALDLRNRLVHGLEPIPAAMLQPMVTVLLDVNAALERASGEAPMPNHGRRAINLD